jgi:predicted enzyme related to lactoylglutathione lyase
MNVKVDGIGGVFIRARDIGALSAWYARHFGFAANESNSIAFRWRKDADPASPGTTVWALFDMQSDYLGSPDRQAMVNYRVPNLDAFLAQLEAGGVPQARPRMRHEYGEFAWVSDCEGNLIELWQPIEGM